MRRTNTPFRNSIIFPENSDDLAKMNQDMYELAEDSKKFNKRVGFSYCDEKGECRENWVTGKVGDDGEEGEGEGD